MAAYHLDGQTAQLRPEHMTRDARIFVANSKFLTNSELEGTTVFFFFRARVVNALQLSLILTETTFIDQYPMMSRLRTLAMAAETVSRFFISRLDLSSATILATTLEL